MPMVKDLGLSQGISVNFQLIDVNWVEKDSERFKVTIRTRWEMVKLYLHELVPHLDYGVFMDIDSVLLEDVSELWAIRKHDKVAAVVKERETGTTHHKEYPNYVNTGVMVLNLKLMREIQFVEKVVAAREALRKRDGHFWPPDQNLFNAFFDQHLNLVEFIDGRYHFNCMLRNNVGKTHATEKLYNIDKPVLIHYCGMTWLKEYVEALEVISPNKVALLEEYMNFTKCDDYRCGYK